MEICYGNVCGLEPSYAKTTVFRRINYQRKVDKIREDIGKRKYSHSHGSSVPKIEFSINKILLDFHGVNI